MESSPAQAPATVMIVDDELFFRKLLRDIFEKEGFDIVAEASDGDEAVTQYKKFRPAVTVMDIFMPEKNGIAATKEIRAFDRGARVLIYTGIGFDEDVEVALQAGAREVVLKSFSAEEVMEVVNRVLAG